MRVHEALHIERVGLTMEQSLHKHVSLLVSISFEYRNPVRSYGTLRVRAESVDHFL
jgi:hypothetical protein